MELSEQAMLIHCPTVRYPVCAAVGYRNSASASVIPPCQFIPHSGYV